MPVVSADIPESLKSGLDVEIARLGIGESAVITAALSKYLGIPVHTLFRVSMSGAVVAGVSDREVTVGSILAHGDFGLGTFASLDGEMVVLEGRVFQVFGAGRVLEAAPDARVPFAVVTRFCPQLHVNSGPLARIKDLERCCDRYRFSGNVFYAIRLDGQFSHVRTRAAKIPSPGTRLVEATKGQSELSFTDIDGTLVGFWSPGFSSAFSVQGYHFHFISADRRHGGHLLDVEAAQLHLRIESLSDFHLAMPASEAFL
jgi:acetolactate decarboxylase